MRYEDGMGLCGPVCRTLDSVHGCVYFQRYPNALTAYEFATWSDDCEASGFGPRGLTVEQEGHRLLGLSAGTVPNAAGPWWFIGVPWWSITTLFAAMVVVLSCRAGNKRQKSYGFPVKVSE